MAKTLDQLLALLKEISPDEIDREVNARIIEHTKAIIELRDLLRRLIGTSAQKKPSRAGESSGPTLREQIMDLIRKEQGKPLSISSLAKTLGKTEASVIGSVTRSPEVFQVNWESRMVSLRG